MPSVRRSKLRETVKQQRTLVMSDPRIALLEQYIALYPDDADLNFEDFVSFYKKLFSQTVITRYSTSLSLPTNDALSSDRPNPIVGVASAFAGILSTVAGACLLLTGIFIPVGIAAIAAGSALTGAGIQAMYPAKHTNWKLNNTALSKPGFGLGGLLVGLGIAAVATGFFAPLGIAAIAIGSFFIAKSAVKTYQKHSDRKQQVKNALVKMKTIDFATKKEQKQQTYDLFKAFLPAHRQQEQKTQLNKLPEALLRQVYSFCDSESVLAFGRTSNLNHKSIISWKQPMAAKYNSCQKVKLEQLPDDTLRNIYSFFDSKSALRFARSSKLNHMNTKTWENWVEIFVSELGIKRDTLDILNKNPEQPCIKNCRNLYNTLKQLKKTRPLEELQPWEILCLSGETQAFEYAVNKLGMNTNTTNQLGENALHIAVLSCQPNIIRCAIEMGIDKNAQTPDGKNALHLAALSGQPKAIKCAIEMGINKNAVSPNGENALHFAVLSGSIAATEFLIKHHGFNPHSRIQDGRTLLHFARRSGNRDMIWYVINELNIYVEDNADQVRMHQHAAMRGRMM